MNQKASCEHLDIGLIYVALWSDVDLIKLGWSKDVTRRMDELGTELITVLARGTMRVERWLLDVFAVERASRQEWFHAGGRLHAYAIEVRQNRDRRPITTANLRGHIHAVCRCCPNTLCGIDYNTRWNDVDVNRRDRRSSITCSGCHAKLLDITDPDTLPPVPRS